MQNIILSIVNKTGITPTQAEAAFIITVDALREKLPASVANQLDRVLAGKEFDYRAVFNDKLQDMKAETVEKLDAMKEEATEKFEEFKGEAAERISSLKEGIKKVF